MKLKLHHVPNPDIPGGYYDEYEHPVNDYLVEVRTLAFASGIYRDWIDNNNLGGGNIAQDSGRLYDVNGDHFATVSFNGRVWSLDNQMMYDPANGYIAVTMKF